MIMQRSRQACQVVDPGRLVFVQQYNVAFVSFYRVIALSSRISITGLEHWRLGVAALRERLRGRWFLFPLALFAAIRLELFALASLSVYWVPVTVQNRLGLYYGIKPLVSGLEGLLWGPWQRWDTMWYLKIATQGYSTGDLSTAFFPLYPLLIKITMPFFGNNGTAASVLIASTAALAAFLLLSRLTLDYFDQQSARLTVLLLAIFPASFFLFAGYAESLFLALALGSLLCARSGRWGWASLLGALVALTRPQGALFGLVLAVEFLLQYREHRVTLPHILWLAVPGFASLAFPAYLEWQFHNPTLFFQVQHWWHRSALPWDTLATSLNVSLHTHRLFDLLYSLHDPLAALLFLGLLGWSLFRLGPTFTVYMAIVLLPPLFSESVFQPLLPLASMWRYVIFAFPGFILLSQVPLLVRWNKPIIFACVLLQAMALFEFTQWVFVG